MRTPTNLFAFNRGLISRLALARVDLARSALSAEVMSNWMPRTLGSMMLRPGLQYLHSTKDDAYAIHIPFLFSTVDTALVELTDQTMRIVDFDDNIISRPSVASTITNGGFTTDLTGWTDSDQGAAVSDWVSEGLRLRGSGTNEARRRQEVTVAGADQNVEHAVTFVVTRGAGTLRIGTSAGGSQYVSLPFTAGTYSMSFTPTGNFHIEIASRSVAPTIVRALTMAPAGPMEIPTPWTEDQLPFIRYDQSGDVIFVAQADHRPHRIERRSPRSWAVTEYLTDDGPFRAGNTGPITLTASAVSGTANLTASADFFTASDVGALFRLASQGQRAEGVLTGDLQFTDPIRVSGVGVLRVFSVVRSGTWTGNLRLQRSLGAPGDWVGVNTYTGNGTSSYDDTLANQIAYYRLGFPSGDFGSGAAEVSLQYASGSIRGTGRVVSVTSPTVAVVDVLVPFGNITGTADWWEGVWSPRYGWPSAVALYDGRLWWAGQDRILGSVSDAFTSFDDGIEGDSGPISRTLGSGPVDSVNWILPLAQLVIGTQGSEQVAKASSFDEPLTPTAFRLLPASTLGSCRRQRAIRIDNTGVFVQCGDASVYELVYDGGTFSYKPQELTVIYPEAGESGLDRMAVQRKPDTRIHCVRGDGKVAVLVFDPAEEVNCWVIVETDGAVEDVVVLPGPVEDRVYYVVRREINNVTRRFLERWAIERDAQGGTDNRIADSFVFYDGASTTVFAGLDHLEGEEVVVWADGKDAGAFTVSGGEVTLPTAFTKATAGLGYSARFKSAKLAHTIQDGRVSLNQRQRIDHVGLVLADTHAQGLRYGQAFDRLDALPLMERGALIDADEVYESFEETPMEVDGEWTVDARICLVAEAPRPCTILAAVVQHSTNFKG